MPWPLAFKLSNLLPSIQKNATRDCGTEFAFKLLSELIVSGDSNLFFSPAGAMLCLLMMHDAAAGETRNEMASALRITSLDPAEVERTTLYLRTSCESRRDVEVCVANSLWCSHQAWVLPAYASRIRDLYHAELSMLDLGAPEAISRINSWVNKKTNGKIPGIVSTLPPLARLVALNAIYFKASWIRPFDEQGTHNKPFTTATRQTRRVPMMSQSGTFPYYEDRNLQAVVLPYKGGVSMYVILPAATTDARRFQPNLTSDSWKSRLARFSSAEGTIRMPRLKFDFDVQLNLALKALGMERAFDESRAEFEGVRSEPPPIWIDEVLHRAAVELNEQGTEAAAVTAIIMVEGAALKNRPPRRFEMTMDRPFFFAIRDQLSGTTLFMGWVGDPA